VAASIQDILRRHLKGNSLENLSEKVSIHLNDTHPSIAIPELMRILVDENNMKWETAWQLTQDVFAYTNHTLMSEAMEKWSVDILGRLLPRHLEIIYQINDLFLKRINKIYPNDIDRIRRMSLVEESNPKQVRMAHLSIIGSHSTNGVARLHSNLLKTKTFKDFSDILPRRFNNKTNGITPRHWLLKANPPLAELISKSIGDRWTIDLYELRKLIPLSRDAAFQKEWQAVKNNNKELLAAHILKLVGEEINPASIFDCQVKRLHEYKRQHMNVLHIIHLYNQLRANPKMPFVPRTFIFGGKAAPGYFMAKLIIKLIHNVAAAVNNDKKIQGKIKIVFLPNYSVSLAEKIMPAADISEQISTAGTEASGTGNMKFCLNGALTIGTLDGANIEIKEQVGDKNIFIFGLNTEEVLALREEGYYPQDHIKKNPSLRQVLEMIRINYFSKNEPGIFDPFVDSMLHHDYYLAIADFISYTEAHKHAGNLFTNQKSWTEKSILNVANTGKFSCDRTIRDYAQEIWKLKPVMIDGDHEA
jgi:starch phosphorylase